MARTSGSSSEATPESSERSRANPMSFRAVLDQLVPAPSDVLEPLKTFPPHCAGMVPFRLGQTVLCPSHRTEYAQLVQHTVHRKSRTLGHNLPSLPVKTISRRHYNPAQYHKVTAHSPGVIRVSPRKNRALSSVITTQVVLSPLRMPNIHITPRNSHFLKRGSVSHNEASKDPRIANYQGESLDGKRHGQGTAMYVNGDVYVGSWDTDCKSGTGKYVYAALGACYKGEWLNDKPHGQGVLVFKNKDKLRAQWEHGTLTRSSMVWLWASGDKYEGDSVNGLRDGQGKFTYHSLQAEYTGGWKQDQRSGQGQLRHCAFLYEGSFARDGANGKGVLVLYKALPSDTETKLDPSIQELQQSLLPGVPGLVLGNTDVIYSPLTAAQFKEQTGHNADDGQFVAGKLNGPGIAKYGKYGMYVGCFKNGQKHGWGIFTYTDPLNVCEWTKESVGEYKGYWHKDQRHGFGIMTWPTTCRYEGQFNRDRRHQVEGTMYFPRGEVYQGGWVDNLMHGSGTLVSVKGITFSGQFVRGNAASSGVLQWPDKLRYEGNVHAFEPHGEGAMLYPTHNIFRGVFTRGRFGDSGRIEYANGDVYEGDWKQGVREGKGTLTSAKTVYTGGWQHDRRHGAGVLRDKTGALLYDGRWINDKPETKRKLTS